MTYNDGAEDVVPADVEPQKSVSEESLQGIMDKQDERAQQYAVEFLKKVIRIRGVRVDREDFLRQELRKLGLGNESVSEALSGTPVQGCESETA